MAKPRIILADTDINYILPIQQKFAEEFFGKIDLEIITDADYFEKLFSTPQRVSVLVIAEQLYHPGIQKHNIGKIFLLTEEKEEGTDDLVAEKIFKYSDVKSVFNEIVGKSGTVISVDNAGKKEPQIVVVTSGAGGTGKTTVAMGLAGCLSRNYRKVLYLHCGKLQCFGHLLKNQAPISNNELYAKISRTGLPVYPELRHMIRRELFDYLPPFKASLVSLGIHMEIFTEIAAQVKKEKDYDYIILDTDSSFDSVKTEMLTIADKVVVVTRQDRASVLATDALVQNINGLSVDKFIFICNCSVPKNPDAFIFTDSNKKFTVSEYVEYFEDYDKICGADFAEQTSIKKSTFLLE